MALLPGFRRPVHGGIKRGREIQSQNQIHIRAFGAMVAQTFGL